MKKFVFGIIFIIFVFGTASVVAQSQSVTDGDILGDYEYNIVYTVIYVDSDATGAGNGSSWDDAFTDLQDALDIASSGNEIWVAEGAYKPTAQTDPSDPRTATFQMKNGVAVYGGFAPSLEIDEFAERDWENKVTVLSGSIDGDNCYTIVTAIDVDNTTSIDGFTVSEADPYTGMDCLIQTQYIGGMYNYNSSPMIQNCTFAGNRSNGMVNRNASPEVANCDFINNGVIRYHSHDQFPGGGMTNFNSSPILTDCAFTDNSDGSNGGGMTNDNSSPIITRCSFINNSVMNANGGGIYNGNNSNPTLVSCSFSVNKCWADYACYVGLTCFGGGIFNSASSPDLMNCTFALNTVDGSGGGMYNSAASYPTMTNCTFTGNQAIECIYCFDHMENGYSGYGGAIFNEDSSPIINNCILWDNTATKGSSEIGGEDGSNPIISYSNIADSNGSGISWNTSIGTDFGGNIDSNPMFIDSANVDFHLSPNSPCINSGTNSAPNLPIADFEGDDRIVNGTVDMGADEYNGHFTSSISGQVDLQGRAGSSGPDWEINAEVQLWEVDADRSTASPLEIYSITTDEIGSFEIIDVTLGTYDITIKGSHTLRAFVEDVEITAGSTTPVNFGTLIEGDCWGDAGPDNVIDGADYSAILFTFGTHPGHHEFIDTCDLNEDGIVDGLDYSIVLFNFGEVGVEPF